MKAYVYGANGAKIADAATPSPKGTQVLVRVHACGLNRADLGMASGHVHGAPAASAPCSAWNGPAKSSNSALRSRAPVGDRVMGSGGAAFAEYTLADHGRLFRSPPTPNEFRGGRHPPRRDATMHNAVVTNGACSPARAC